MSKKLKEAILEGENWMFSNGVVTKEGHLLLKSMLETSINGVKRLDYFTDDTSLRVHIVVYFSATRLFFMNVEKLTKGVYTVLKDCLPDYDILVEVQRFKKES